jgi:MFS family permease
MPLFLVRELGFSEASYGFLFAVNTMIIIIFEIPITAAITHWNYRRTLSLGSFLFATGFGAMALFTSMPAMVGTVVVWTVGEMILFPSMNAYVSDMAPAKQRGQYMGAYMACFSMSFIAAPWAGTLILDRFGGKVLWIAIFTFGMLSPLLITWLKLPKTHETASNS